MAERMARRRVKLYALNPERQWDDRGTGHVTSTYVERLKGMSLLVRAETDGTPLLESKIQTDTAYQKQQGTLIVWSEGDNFDLALSFQEKAGCDEIWEKICQVQGKDPSVDFTQEVVDESEEERFEEVNDSNLWVELPPCELGKLDQINELLAASLHNVNRQDKIATTIENESYIKKLIDLFRLCEDLDNRESLHTLYEIFKNIFLLNKNSLLEVLCAEENIFDVVGILEYDPTSVCPKKHRDFLRTLSKFNEVIPIENNELINKIHQTYRVQYIQDVALPNQAVYEENMPSTLSSFIFFNKIEIVTVLSEDERFLSELFVQLGSEDISIDKRRDLILFLKEFCTFSQTLQPPNRENFYKTLSSFGVLGALECTLAVDEPVVKAASVDVLGFFVEFSPSMVRDYMLQQQHKVEEEHYLLNIMLEQMVVDCDPEMGGAVQLMGILRILIDPENMLATNNKAERADFLAFFYKHSIHYLIAPLLSNTAGDVVVREDYQTAQLVALILELLAFCVEHHTYHIKNYIIHRDLLRRVMVLMKSKHTFLVLSAVRFIRKIIGMRDEFYNRHIISCNLFAPLVDAYVRNNARYNLLDSAILEIFEFIKTEDVKSLTMYSMEKFGDVFNRIEYVQTFNTLRTRYNQHQDKIRDREKSTAAVQSLGLVRATTPGNAARYRRDMRDMEAEEEMWFSSDDCDEEYHSPLKQELLKGNGGVVAADIEESLEDDEEEGALFGATSPDPHRLTATPLLRDTDKLSKECVVDTDGAVAGVLDGAAVVGVVEEEEDKVAPHSPASGVSVSRSLHHIIKPCNSEQLYSGAPAVGGLVPYDCAAGQPLVRAVPTPLDDKVKGTSSPVSSAAATATTNNAMLMGVGAGRKISLVDYDENSDEEEEEEEELEMETGAITGGSQSHVKVSAEVVAQEQVEKDALSAVASAVKTTSVLAEALADKPADAEDVTVSAPKQDPQDAAPEIAPLGDAGAKEDTMDTAPAVDSVLVSEKEASAATQDPKMGKTELVREKIDQKKGAEGAGDATVDEVEAKTEVAIPAKQDAEGAESKQENAVPSLPGKVEDASKSPEKKSAKEVNVNGEHEVSGSPPPKIQEPNVEPVEESSKAGKGDKEHQEASAVETEKKRVRPAEEDVVSGTAKREPNTSIAKCAVAASVDDEGVKAEENSPEACTANGVANDADGLAEGEALRKRPRLAVD